ncbi:MAG: hypothetical protein INR64_09840 [Caulobacteraceae bacterium]|nr:hypothetical protein [Caulobacter sp.]
MWTRGLIAGFCAWAALAGAAQADPPPFDLAGPTLTVNVTHAGATLPIGETPNLSEGDTLSIKADLPPSQSVRYLLVAAFLRGATNPPPKSWFFRAQTWTPKGRDGLTVKVPAEAQQAIVFLAPQTGGDFNTLVGAVRGRPGAFVRASQDLNQASLDRSRLDAFLAGLSRSGANDPARLKTVSPLLARSLVIKLNTDCFQRAPELQAACLMQGQDGLILNDGHSRSIVEALTSGPSADLAFQLGASPVAGYGVTNPYIGAAFDIARILDSFRTAQFQYIPALSRMSGDRVSLVLNAPPSFQNPRSVIVAALPPVEPAQSPPLRAVDPAGAYCAARTDLVLPVEGAPLVYSTRYAHDMVLRATAKDGHTLDLPVTADPSRGGLVVDAGAVAAARLGAPEGRLQGFWGFTPFEGPAFHLQTPETGPWRLADQSRLSLVAGRDDVVRLEGGPAPCVRDVTLQPPSGEPRVLSWKAAGPDAIEVTVPLGEARPGPAALRISQYGRSEVETASLQVLSQAARLDGLGLHAGDAAGVLTGARLDEVAAVSFAGVEFTPGALVARDGADSLALTAADPAGAARLAAGQSATAKVTLKDGRVLRVKATVAPPRPQASLISMSQAPPAVAPFRLGDPAELPRGSVLTFSLRGEGTTRFTGGESVEVAGADGGGAVTLTLTDGLTEADPQVLVATLDSAKAFGPSVFGPLRYRVLQGGAAGDWRPLATLVRLPKLAGLQCPAAGGRCQLGGEDLFLIEAVSSDPAFANAEPVSEGYTGRTVSVPHPRGGRLLVRLHDDPGVVSTIVF